MFCVPPSGVVLTLVANAGVPLVTRTAVSALAASLLSDTAWMGRVRRGIEVGLPDVHLSAASAILAGSRVAVGATPALNVGLFMTTSASSS